MSSKCIPWAPTPRQTLSTTLHTLTHQLSNTTQLCMSYTQSLLARRLLRMQHIQEFPTVLPLPSILCIVSDPYLLDSKTHHWRTLAHIPFRHYLNTQRGLHTYCIFTHISSLSCMSRNIKPVCPFPGSIYCMSKNSKPANIHPRNENITVLLYS